MRDIEIEPVLIDETTIPESLTIEKIKMEIIRADFIIADLTGNNPNVMYELGFAHALRKTVLPIIQYRDYQIPNAMKGFLFVVYNAEELDNLLDQIKNWLIRIRHERSKGQV